MGLAIFKKAGSAYAINRQAQNVIPKDHSLHKYLVDQANLSFVYSLNLIDNKICVLESVSLGLATLPYVYQLCDSTGADKTYNTVEINEISGAITLKDNYTGEAVYVKVVPLYNLAGNSYPKGSKAAVAAVVQAITEHEVITHTAELTNFVYSTLTGGTAWPSSIQASETALHLAKLEITYDGQPVSIDLNNIPNTLTNYEVKAVIRNTNTSVKKSGSTLKALTIVKNDSSSSREITITISASYNGESISNSYNINQGANTLSTITFQSYNDDTTTPISLASNTTLNASDFKVNGTYSNGDNSNLSVQSISTSNSTGFGPSLTVTSSTTGVYLKVGDIVTLTAVPITVTSLTLVWDSTPVTIPASALAYPYAENADSSTTTYKIASDTTGKCAHIYDAISNVVNNQLIFKIVDGLTDDRNNSCIVYSNNAYPTTQGNREITVVDWEERYSVLNLVEVYNLPSTSASYLYLVIRSVASDSPLILFGHYENS